MSFVFYTSFVFYPHFKSVFLAFGVRSKRRLVKTLATNSLSTFMQCAHSAFGSAQVMSVEKVAAFHTAAVVSAAPLPVLVRGSPPAHRTPPRRTEPKHAPRRRSPMHRC